MIRAQLTLPDGRTPGGTRYGSTVILACIAQGCRIVPNPLNKIPDEWGKYILRMDSDADPVLEAAIAQIASAHLHFAANPLKPKRGRPKKVKP